MKIDRKELGKMSEKELNQFYRAIRNFQKYNHMFNFMDNSELDTLAIQVGFLEQSKCNERLQAEISKLLKKGVLS